MLEKIYQEIPEHSRELELSAQCSKVVEGEYKRYFTQEEVSEKEKEYTKSSAQVKRLAAEYKAEIKAMNDTIKAKRKALNDLLEIVDNGFINVEGKMYLFDDQESGDMYIYDKAGVLIEKRRLRPDEKQTFLPFRKASND
jgi:hypothetical protein